MPYSGCSALHGVNPNFLKKSQVSSIAKKSIGLMMWKFLQSMQNIFLRHHTFLQKYKQNYIKKPSYFLKSKRIKWNCLNVMYCLYVLSKKIKTAKFWWTRIHWGWQRAWHCQIPILISRAAKVFLLYCEAGNFIPKHRLWRLISISKDT